MYFQVYQGRNIYFRPQQHYEKKSKQKTKYNKTKGEGEGGVGIGMLVQKGFSR